MLTTYEAILRGNLLEWRKEIPSVFTGQAIHVQVTLLDQPDFVNNQGQCMAAALEKLAQSDIVTNENVQMWEREWRIDRPLPGRD